MIYSYHTFYFPFIWKTEKMTDIQKLAKTLEKDWRDISVTGFEQVGGLKSGDYSLVADYQVVQYFTPAARRSLFGWGEGGFVRCMEYKFGKDSEYHIRCGNNIWNLRIDGIRLKIYNTGIAVLSIETENHHYKTLKDVKSINENGRRIFAPYFVNGKCYSCADELGIKGVGYDSISTNMPKREEDCVPGFIRALFPEGVQIKPAIDDRMFVTSLVNDAKAFECLSAYEKDENASKSLYEFIYIDEEGCCTCPTASMRDKLLERSVYKRWLESKNSDDTIGGSIYGITDYSFVCITACDDSVYIELPFLTIYNHMVSSVIAQRATILAFDAVVSNMSCGFEKKSRCLDREKLRNLQKLQEQYIAFLNQHMNIEVTNQEQGIELYTMFQKELYIVDEMQNLEKEISALSNAAETKNSNNLSYMAMWLSVIILAVEILDTYIPENISGCMELIVKIVFVASPIILVVGVPKLWDLTTRAARWIKSLLNKKA